MRFLSIILISLFISSFSFAAVDPCALKIRDVEYSDGGSDEDMAPWKDQALLALNICSAKGNADTLKLAALMKTSCEKMSYKTNSRLGACYLSAAKVIGLSF